MEPQQRHNENQRADTFEVGTLNAIGRVTSASEPLSQISGIPETVQADLFPKGCARAGTHPGLSHHF